MNIYITVGAYLIIMLIIGWVSHKVTKHTPEDYFLASRSMGILVIFFTLVATNFSSFFFIGFSGEGYRTGYSYYAMISFGTAFIAVSFFLIGYKAWKTARKYNFITPPELIGNMSKNKWLKNLYLLVMVFFTLPYLAIQPIGAGYLIHILTGQEVPYFTGAVVLTVIIVVYVFLGGMRSVAITDLAQGLVMFIVSCLALWFVADNLGGIGKANEAVYAMHPDLFSRQGGGNFFNRKKWFSLMILWTLSVPMFPHMFMRFFIARSATTLKTSTILYSIVPFILFMVPVAIGIMGHLSFQGLEGKESDQILPLMLMKHTPAWIASIVMVGALAAFMSTLDSQLLALSTLLTRDVYMPLFNQKASYKIQVYVGKILIVVCALVGLVIAYRPPGTIFTIATQAFTGYAILFPVTVGVLHFKNVSYSACAWSIVVGTLVLMGIYFELVPDTFLLGFEPIVPIITLVTTIIVIGSLLKNRNYLCGNERKDLP